MKTPDQILMENLTVGDMAELSSFTRVRILNAMKEVATQAVLETVAVTKEHADGDTDIEGATHNSLRILGLS